MTFITSISCTLGRNCCIDNLLWCNDLFFYEVHFIYSTHFTEAIDLALLLPEEVILEINNCGSLQLCSCSYQQ